jgi:hypothetical protein
MGNTGSTGNWQILFFPVFAVFPVVEPVSIFCCSI